MAAVGERQGNLELRSKIEEEERVPTFSDSSSLGNRNIIPRYR